MRIMISWSALCCCLSCEAWLNLIGRLYLGGGVCSTLCHFSYSKMSRWRSGNVAASCYGSAASQQPGKGSDSGRNGQEAPRGLWKTTCSRTGTWRRRWSGSGGRGSVCARVAPGPKPRLEPTENICEETWRWQFTDASHPVWRSLERICREEWDKLPKSVCAKLVETYSRRIEAVTAADRAPTKSGLINVILGFLIFNKSSCICKNVFTLS